MRRTIPLVASALLIGALVPGQARAALGGTDLPLRGSQSGYMTVNLSNGQAHVVTTGQLSHLGSTTAEQDLQIVPTGPGTRSFSGTWTITVASGDQLFGTSSGTTTTVDSIHSTTVGRCISTGGTGRLANTSLTFDVTAQITLLSVDGSIAMQAIEVTADGRLSH
jgi:hypothetical protein